MDTSALPPARSVGVVIAAGLSAWMLVACGAAGGGSSADRTTESYAQGPAPEAAADDIAAAEGESAEESADGGEGGTGVGADVEIDDRDLVHTADLSVRVDDVSEASEAAKDVAVDADGYVAFEQVSTPTGGTPESSLTLRIPDEGYEDALSALAELGDRSSLERSVEDVTEEVTDVESRIESAEASLATLRGYLDEAEDVEDLLEVEREIQSRQAELESLQARMESLSNLTSYSTVHLRLMPPETYLEEPDEDSIGFMGGLERGWRALVTLGEGIAVALGWLLPFLAVAVVVAAGPWIWWRRRRAARAPQSAERRTPFGRRRGRGGDRPGTAERTDESAPDTGGAPSEAPDEDDER
ncbi:DUF4349 domain-containing protein [Nocardiopsis sp. YSL2]|uniref:DUF4349 domain-containing protein n=1 Tax=Nocardiopsis sp. YSL2 TaxID=2939492 RepID=UPI0026F40B9C|nr:DUF4349 domain-containing protein [Nocardiopsis sp. YSL2]